MHQRQLNGSIILPPAEAGLRDKLFALQKLVNELLTDLLMGQSPATGAPDQLVRTATEKLDDVFDALGSVMSMQD